MLCFSHFIFTRADTLLIFPFHSYLTSFKCLKFDLTAAMFYFKDIKGQLVTKKENPGTEHFIYCKSLCTSLKESSNEI